MGDVGGGCRPRRPSCRRADDSGLSESKKGTHLNLVQIAQRIPHVERSILDGLPSSGHGGRIGSDKSGQV